jgi:DNA-binding protein H-NS
MTTLSELLKQQEMLKGEIERARLQENTEVIAKVRELVQVHGLSESDVFPTGGRRRGVRLGKVAPKYRDPISGKTWTGRGKAPKWLEGKDRCQFSI